MEKEKLIIKLNERLKETDIKIQGAAMGFDEGYYTGMSEAFEQILELLKTEQD